jgi:hypothetical protein
MGENISIIFLIDSLEKNTKGNEHKLHYLFIFFEFSFLFVYFYWTFFSIIICLFWVFRMHKEKTPYNYEQNY